MVMLCMMISYICCALDLIFKEKIEKGEIQARELKRIPLKIRRAHHNSGFLMNTLDNKPKVVRKVALGVAMFFALYQMFLLASKKCAAAKISGALMFGGAMSNLYDRMVRGYVVDYVSIKTKWEKMGKVVFNIADVCIFLGGIGLILFQGKAKRK
jgi:Lipoprotein signal peptidase